MTYEDLELFDQDVTNSDYWRRAPDEIITAAVETMYAMKIAEVIAKRCGRNADWDFIVKIAEIMAIRQQANAMSLNT